MSDLLDLADAIFRGETTTDEHHPFLPSPQVVEVAPGVAFVAGFSNAIAFSTTDGLVLIDSGGFLTREQVRDLVRGWSQDRVNTVIYSHGHVDHVFGVGAFEEERLGPIRVVAHENVPPRFDRYVLTAGYNSVINQRQFQVPGLQWPTDFRYPDDVYRERLRFDVGGVTFELHHAKGETDDHTWTWVPEKKVLCCGDLFIWCSPNAGNPQKAQRFPREWAEALRDMQMLGAEIMLPGHGLPIVGAERVGQVLEDTATYLESVVEQTLELMNTGMSLDDIVARVEPPADLAAKPYLRPIYDEPDFIVRNLWRLYGGWYDGDPSHLKPAPAPDLASAIVELAGGVESIVAAARARAEADDLVVACDLIEIAWQAQPDDAEVRTARAEIYEARAAAEPSTMSKGIYSWAASESTDR